MYETDNGMRPPAGPGYHLPMDGHDYSLLSSLLRDARMGRYPLPVAIQHEYGGVSGFLKRYLSAEVLEREVSALSDLLGWSSLHRTEAGDISAGQSPVLT